jgi:SNF2 family DNA or RNA helicase
MLLVLLLRRFDTQAIENQTQVAVELFAFLRAYDQVSEFLGNSQIEVELGAPLSVVLERWFEEQAFVSNHPEPQKNTLTEIMQMLETSNWDVNPISGRILKERQIIDLNILLATRNGANFSVPGAGKTTVLLALHQLLRLKNEMELLVVAPGNAFGAWSRATSDCLQGHTDLFQRLESGKAIEQLLEQPSNYRIISYRQLASPAVEEAVKRYISSRSVHLVLDESHRVKSGTDGVMATSALNIAPFAFRRDILSGTPIPNAISDLAPQVDFLFPGAGLGMAIRDSVSANKITTPFRVRTRYSELGIPRPTPVFLDSEMSNAQKIIYSLIAKKSLQRLRRLQIGGNIDYESRKSVMSLLQAAIDPELAANNFLANGDAIELGLEETCRELIEDPISPRLSQAIDITVDHINNGRKVVLWAPFTGTIKKLASALEHYGSQTLFGETPNGPSDVYGTRENVIERFHNSSKHNVLVANPAAGGEGISLHEACQTAIYVGRTFNAAHYMQSRDRICRLGLPPDAKPTITILESLGSRDVGRIDLSVRRRLDMKIEAMGRVLDDPDLLEISLESEEADQSLEDGTTYDDLEDLMSELRAPDIQ